MALASLKFWRDRFIWTSPRHAGGDTSRPAIAVLVGGWGELSIGHAGVVHTAYAIAVGPQVLRSVRADHGFYSLNLDPVHRANRALRLGYFSRAPIWNTGKRLPDALQARVEQAIRAPLESAAALALSDAVLDTLFPELADAPAVDPRVVQVAAWLRQHLPSRVPLAELAASCELSPGRLRHLFRRELGVPLKSYLLAMKMRKAAQYFGAGRPLTEIAHAMGFSDSAHLSKAFQAYFAVPPSMLANRELVDLQVCEPD
jgi:AraC-like DNA-binding protein